MFTTVKVTRESATGLSTDVWTFTLIDFDLVLDRYQHGTRPSIRHNFRFDEPTYARLTPKTHRLPLTDVPWPLDVVEEAREKLLAQFNAKLKVGRWGVDIHGR